MTDLLDDLITPSDAELIARVRGGDADAYGELFERHVDAARRLACQLSRGADVDDLVSDAFTKVMVVLQRGGGPDVSFRAYLLTAVRRVHVDRVRAQSRLTPIDDLDAFDPGVPFQDTAVTSFENGAVARAFATLPERWQMVLWHLEVEGQKPADVAPLLGMSANSVSALAYRAREGLRQAFLAAHLVDTPHSECRWVLEHLGGHVRKGLARRESAKVQEHLDGCRRCTATHLELCEVNADLRGVLAPLLLGSLATGYLASTSGGAARATTGVLAILGRAKDYVGGQLVPSAGGAFATTVAVATAVALSISGTAPREPAEEGDDGRSVIADGPLTWGATSPTTGAPGLAAGRRGGPAVGQGSARTGGSSRVPGVGQPGVTMPSGDVSWGGVERAWTSGAPTPRRDDIAPTEPLAVPEAPTTQVLDVRDAGRNPPAGDPRRPQRPARVAAAPDPQPPGERRPRRSLDRPLPDIEEPTPGDDPDTKPGRDPNRGRADEKGAGGGDRRDGRPDTHPGKHTGHQKGKGPGHDQGLHKGHHKPHPQGKQPGEGQGKHKHQSKDRGKGPK